MKLSTAEENIIDLVREIEQEAYKRGKGISYCYKCGDEVYGKEPSLCGNCAS